MKQKFVIKDQDNNILFEFDNAHDFGERLKEIGAQNYKQTELKKEKQSSFAKGCVLTAFVTIVLLCFFG